MRTCLALLLGLTTLASGGCAGYDVIDVDGVQRRYLVHRPPGEAPGAGWPLVVAYHGAFSTPDDTETYTGLSELADREGFLVVYPKGKRRLWNDGRLDDDFDDVGFTLALIDRMVEEEGVDPDRVFATGISNGAFMSYRVACDLSDHVAAVAPVAGSLSRELAGACRPRRAVPVMAFMGTDDDLVPYEGGELGGEFWGGRFGTLLSATETADWWGRRNGCTEVTVDVPVNEVEDGTQLETLRHQGCADGAEVVLHTIAGGGHTWPGAEEVRALGTVTREIDASEAMWAFFMDVTDSKSSAIGKSDFRPRTGAVAAEAQSFHHAPDATSTEPPARLSTLPGPRL